MPAGKIDLYKRHKDEYVASRKPALVQIKEASYLGITGQGEPGGDAFTAKVGALYGVAYTIKMTRKFEGRGDYVVCKLEAQWWHDRGQRDFRNVPRHQWRWRLLIRTPDFITQADLDRAHTVLVEKGKGPQVRQVELTTLAEGPCVQMLHVGPYDREHETIAQMKAFAQEHGLVFHGRHHEIYLSDPRRVPPDRLKTILRQPVKDQ